MIRDTNIKVDRERCIACGICVDRCVMDNLRLSVAPCRQSCPLHINCQEFIKLIAQGKEQQAIESFEEFLPFLGVLGLLCHAPCEKACARKKVDQSVHIHALERYLAENSSKTVKEATRPELARPNNKKVAIWGAGPAAMMAAWRLRRSGHQTVMFMPEEEQGGALQDCKATSQRYMETIHALIDTIGAIGSNLISQTEPGQTLSLEELLDLYDAVIITYKDDRELLRIRDRKDIEQHSLRANPRTLQSVKDEKIFICKDYSESGSRIVNALAEGKTAAESAHRFVSGAPLMWGRNIWDARGYVKDYASPYEQAKHVQPERRTPIRLKEDPEEIGVSRSYTKDEALFEAERCLSCGRPFDQNQTCWYCLPCEIECPHNAIEVRIPYLLR